MEQNSPYTDDALQYGQMVQNVFNPPDERGPMKNTAVVQPPGMDLGVPPPKASMAPSTPAASAPAQPMTPAPRSPVSIPATVTTSGNDKGPTARQDRTWADYVRQATDASMANLQASGKAADQLRSMPSAAQVNQPLEQQRQAASQPTQMRDAQGNMLPQYKPGIGTRIVRGIDALRRGGVFGLVDPSSVGVSSYGSPNQAYQQAETQRQAKVNTLDQQINQNIADQKSDVDRLGKIGSEERANATGYKDVATDATNQQKAENEASRNTADAQQKAADLAQKSVPTNYEQAVIASHNPSLTPQQKQAYGDAAKQMAQQELKKFSYASRATGGGSGPSDALRQSMIDQATSQVSQLNDYAYDPDANNGDGGFFDPASPKKVYTVNQFVDLKNKISAKLDADLAKKKLRPLGVRFNAQGSKPGVDAQGNLTPPGTQPQRASVPAQASQTGDVRAYVGDVTTQERSVGHYAADKNGNAVVYRGGAWRNPKTGKEVK